jgi:hypothetical protein
MLLDGPKPEPPKESVQEPSKEPNKEESKEQPRDQAKEQPNGLSKKQSKDLSRDQSKDRSRDWFKEHSRDQSKDRSRDWFREHSRDQSKDRSKDWFGEHSRDQSKDRSRDWFKEQPKEKPKEKPEEQTKQPPKEQSKEPTKEIPETEKEDSPLYILQPKTYTPQASPLPSPRPPETQQRPAQPSPRLAERPKKEAERPKKELEVRVQQRPRGTSPRPPYHAPNPEARRPRTASSESSVESAAQVTLEHAKPRVEQVRAKPQIVRPRMVEIGARSDGKTGTRPNPRPVKQAVQPVSGPDPAQAPEVVIPTDPEVVTADTLASTTKPTQRTSLRQRVSLKTTPPESIQVPPNTLNIQPVHGGLPRTTYQAPDSAYGSDLERPPANTTAPVDPGPIDPVLVDFKPPFAQQGSVLIPSPLSDRQFFRPVQASPHSPLQQQRPHTSGTVGPQHFPMPPPRHTPSAMGMSFVSSSGGSTIGDKSLKKKRSAFGWLKKAFALDEEERAVFEQRKQQQIENPYYQGRTQEWIDGKRVRPRQPGPY